MVSLHFKSLMRSEKAYPSINAEGMVERTGHVGVCTNRRLVCRRNHIRTSGGKLTSESDAAGFPQPLSKVTRQNETDRLLRVFDPFPIKHL